MNIISDIVSILKFLEGALLNYDVILSSHFIELSAIMLFLFYLFCFLIHTSQGQK